MSYSTVLANMQKTDRALRVCLGSAKYKKMKSLEDRAIKTQQMILEIRTFIQQHENNPTVKLLKELLLLKMALKFLFMSCGALSELS